MSCVKLTAGRQPARICRSVPLSSSSDRAPALSLCHDYWGHLSKVVTERRARLVACVRPVRGDRPRRPETAYARV